MCAVQHRRRVLGGRRHADARPGGRPEDGRQALSARCRRVLVRARQLVDDHAQRLHLRPVSGDAECAHRRHAGAGPGGLLHEGDQGQDARPGHQQAGRPVLGLVRRRHEGCSERAAQRSAASKSTTT